MNLILNPGFVYIFFSKKRPNDVKIGKAKNVEDREFALSLADPDLSLYRCEHFLSVFSAESHLHAIFASRRIDRTNFDSKSEHFKVSKAEAGRELDKLVESRAAERLEFTNHCRQMVDIGALKFDISKDVEECQGSALSTLLSHVPSNADGRNVKALIVSALSTCSTAPMAACLLLKSGLMAYAVEGVVLLDKTKTSSLERVFKSKQCQKTWRIQLAKIAGLSKASTSVNLATWLDTTQAGLELVDRVNPLGYNKV